MCRNIKTLANFAPPATDDEIRASALQFVRKLSGTTHPSHANEAIFDRFLEAKEAVESEFGEPLSWERRDDAKMSKIYVKRPGSLEDDAEALNELQTKCATDVANVLSGKPPVYPVKAG